jgi:hypothetical protein
MHGQACDPERGYKDGSIADDTQCQCDQTTFDYITADASGVCICSPQKGYAMQPFLTSNKNATNPTGCLACKLPVKPQSSRCKVMMVV